MGESEQLPLEAPLPAKASKGLSVRTKQKKQKRAKSPRPAREDSEGESVKGKMSSAYKGFSDADPERLFGEHGGADSGRMMTEEQARMLVHRERLKTAGTLPSRGGTAAQKRIQKELSEWE